MQDTYGQLRVHVFLCATSCAPQGRIARKHRRDPAMREERKRFYREMLGCHERHQELVLTLRL